MVRLPLKHRNLATFQIERLCSWLRTHLGTCQIRLPEGIAKHIPIVKIEISHYSSQYSARLSVHPNGPVVNLMAQPDNNRRLRRHLPDDRPRRLLAYIVSVVLVCTAEFVSLILKRQNRSSTFQLQRRATEHSSTCNSISLYTISCVHSYRLRKNVDYKKYSNILICYLTVNICVWN
jgi:hypothetical protein